MTKKRLKNEALRETSKYIFSRLAEIDSMGRYTPLYDTTFTTERENAHSKLKVRKIRI